MNVAAPVFTKTITMKQKVKGLFFIAAMLLLSGFSAYSQELWFGLWNSSMDIAPRKQVENGYYDQYVRLTAQNSKPLIGSKLRGIRFWIYDKTAVQSANVWLTTSYSKGGTATVMNQNVDVNDLKDYVHDNEPTVVMFENDYDVLPAGNPYANIIVGVTLQMSGANDNYLMGTTAAGTTNSHYIDGDDVAKSNGAMPLQVLAATTQADKSSVKVQPLDEKVLIKNQTAELNVAMINEGYEPLRHFDYVVTIDGESLPAQHFELPTAVNEYGYTFDVPISFTVPAKTEAMNITVSISTINGETISGVQPQDVCRLIVLDKPTTKRVVMEEFTGTWCHNCIRGTVGTEIMAEQFGDLFIPIAIHGDERDPMMITDYYSSEFFKAKMRILGGYPSCTIDRVYDCDPYCGYKTTGAFMTDEIVEEALKRVAVADLEATVHWTDEAQTAIAYNVSTRFGYSNNSDNYRLLLVLTANDLQGEGRSWQQRNGYNNYTGTEEGLLPYVGQGEYLTDYSYNHVAIAVAGVDGGLEGSIELPFTAGQPQQFRYVMDVAGNELVQNPANLHAVVMLIDGRDGSIVNAVTTPVADITGIKAVETQSGNNAVRYNLSGQRVDNNYKGIVIENGTKRVVK